MQLNNYKQIVILICLNLFINLASSSLTRAQVVIDITRGNVDPLPIAITLFNSDQDKILVLGQKITDIIKENLQRSGLFKPIDEAAFIEEPSKIVVRPRFGDWRVINAQALVTGNLIRLEDGQLKVEFRLWDTYAEQQMTGFVYTSKSKNLRRIAHLISDQIYQRLTGEQGYFDTRIVYVSETGPADMRIKRLAVMDQDGANHQFLTDGNDLVLTPRFSPTKQEITYLSYYRNKPRVYIYSIETGQQEVLGDFEGMTFAPRFSPDGNRVIMSLAKNGNSDIYTMDIVTRRVERLTRNPAIDTSASFAPDGTRIVFNSDRSGTQQLYVMDASGKNQKRVSFGRGRYATPVWSPRGDLIAFTKFRKGRFHIGVMRPDGSGERLLTESFLDEAPTWAPNGRVLMFFRQRPSKKDGSGGSVNLWSIDLTGFNERKIITPLQASDPAWSPLGE